MKDRLITSNDLPLLAESLAADEYHQGTKPEFFIEPGTVCNVYEDEAGPICFVRGCKALRLDIQYVDNLSTERNMTAMMWGWDKLVKKAKENGFLEIIFQTNSPLLKRFCKNRFGFIDSQGELRKIL